MSKQITASVIIPVYNKGKSAKSRADSSGLACGDEVFLACGRCDDRSADFLLLFILEGKPKRIVRERHESEKIYRRRRFAGFLRRSLQLCK